MSKVVAVQIGEKRFLVETDETIEVPADVNVSVAASDPNLPKGMREVVSVEDVERNFADVKDVIVSCCKNLHSAISNIPKPERFAVEFGVKLAGETGIPMLTKASGEANFKVTVEWKQS